MQIANQDNLESAEQVINSRDGAVLAAKTILKEDHFPGCQNTKLRPLIDGAPNFRQVEGLPVYGVAIPTVAGLRNVLTFIGGKYRRAIWHNMREEPLVYVNGQPYVLREVERPFMNLEHTGIAVERVEKMESRLQMEVLAEVGKFGGRLMLSKETDDGQVVDVWEAVHADAVQTPQQVFLALKAEGFDVETVRVPVTDEKAPKERDCDFLAASCAAAGEGTALLFNCQMGRGRTTTAMVIASLVHLRLSPPQSPLPQARASPLAVGLPAADRVLLRGEYSVVRSLLRALEGGPEAKAQVDEIIDRCAHMQNLREAILTYRRAISKEVDETRREAALLRGAEYLERYFVLISFGAYVQSAGFAPGASTFESWMHARPELQSILKRMLWRNPLSALAAPPLLAGVEAGPGDAAGPGDEATEAAHEVHISNRTGAVLGKQTILKEEPYPGIHNSAIPQEVEGAANFRQAAGYPIFGLAISPVAAIRRVLERVGCGPGGGKSAIWHNMREETTVYVNGTPYVLREAARPLGNMQEYTGIDARRVEEMETRLRADVLAEFAAGGATLVTREAADGQMSDVWIPAEGALVQTPRDVYDALAAEGYACRYVRVPVTHTRAPKSRDFDILVAGLRAAPPDAQLVFSCQAGHGRTTTAMVVAALLARAPAGAAAAALRPEGAPRAQGKQTAAAGEERKALRRGEWVVVQRLLRLLPGGEAAKNQLDDVVDACGAVMNLREGILEGADPKHGGGDGGGGGGGDAALATEQLLRRQPTGEAGAAAEQRDTLQREALRRGCEWLDRYMVLIIFAAWVRSGMRDSFKLWKRQRPELRALRNSVAANPLGSLEYSRALEELPAALGEGAAARTLAQRSGAVLAQRTILKEHYLSGGGSGGAFAVARRSSSGFPADLASLVPNFTQAHAGGGIRVCGLSTPSLATLRELLLRMGAGPLPPPAAPTDEDVLDELNEDDGGDGGLSDGGSDGGGGAAPRRGPSGEAQRLVVLTDMREELGVYVQGQFFLLRELAAPVVSIKNIGIQGAAVEELERQLKADVLAEAARAGGRLLLHREGGVRDEQRGWQLSPDAETIVEPFWAESVDADAVLTAAEAAAQLCAEGFRLQYKRVPMTRMRPSGREGAVDMDQLRGQLLAAGKAPGEAAFLFAGQTGRGSVGFAMAAACCMLRPQGSAPRQPPRPEQPLVGASPDAASSPLLRQWVERGGESRDVLALMRILKQGPNAKELGDWALDACASAADLRQDLAACRARAKAPELGTVERTAAAALGLNYLRRYLLLVSFCSFCLSHPLGGRDDERDVSFAYWVDNRPELLLLLQRCTL